MFTSYRELVYVKLLLPFVVGILLGIYVPVNAFVLAAITLCGAVIIIGMNSIPNTSLSWEWKSGLAINLLLASLGCLTLKVHNEINDRSHFSRYYLQNAEWVARINEPPTLQDSTYRIKAEVTTIFQAKKAIGTTGKVIIYLQQDGTSSQLKYGDLIGLSAPIKETALAANPYEFDRKTYFAWQQYYHQSSAYANQWKPLGINNGNVFRKGLYTARERCLQTLSQHLDGEALAVTASLLLGYRDFMDKDLTQNYSAAGVVHILSVSGMHLGILVWIAIWMLGLLRVPEKYKWTEYLLLLLLVWVFACLTGLAPSMLRAALIATFLLTGKLLRRDMHPLNGLAASAFFLFTIDPYLLMDIGFQLSYLAVVGIMLMYPALYKRGYIRWWLPDKVYQSIVLSVSATAATIPLTLYYFHQASVYFMFSNLAVIPLSMAIMVGGTLLLVLSPFQQLGQYFAFATKWLVMVMNHVIEIIARLPMAQIKGIAIVKEEALILGVAIFLFMWFVYSGRVKLLLASLMVFMGLFSYGIARQKMQATQSKLVVYSINRHTAIDVIEGKHDLIIADNTLLQKNEQIEQHINPLRWYSGLGVPMIECIDKDTSKLQWQTTWRDGRYLQIRDKRILMLSSWKRMIPPRAKLQVDYLILAPNAVVKLREVALCVEPKLFIINAGSSIRKSESIMDQCKDLGWKYYDTRKQGAFVLDINPTLSKHPQ